MSLAAPRHSGLSEAEVQARCSPLSPPYFSVTFKTALERCLRTTPKTVFDRHNVRLQEYALASWREARDPTEVM